MTIQETERTTDWRPLTSQAYRITLDDGRVSFFALSIEDPENEDAWLMSDTVRSLDNAR